MFRFLVAEKIILPFVCFATSAFITYWTCVRLSMPTKAAFVCVDFEAKVACERHFHNLLLCECLWRFHDVMFVTFGVFILAHKVVLNLHETFFCFQLYRS